MQIIPYMKTSLMQLRWSVVCFPMLICMPLAAMAQDVTGIWRTELTEEGHLEVQIEACGDTTLCGTILRARDLDGNEQPYEYAGKRMIWDMVASSPTSWVDGQIWDPRDNRTYRSRMQLSEGNLLVSGCVLRICQTQTWKRDR
jgi:uncharacterized protein (DUF2147 family)